jgi:hypothetical protein
MTEDQDIPPRAKRDNLLVSADLVAEGGRPIGRARVRNLSASGLMADCTATLAEGERLLVILRGAGEIQGTVSWVRDGRIGIAFDQEIDPLAARRPVGAGAPPPAPVAPISYRPKRPIRSQQ